MQIEAEHGRRNKRLTVWWYHWKFRPTWICRGIEQERSYERYYNEL